MFDLEPTVKSRELGRALARAAAAKGLNGRQIAFLLKWSPSRISRLYSGKRGARLVDIAAFLALVDVTGTRREELLELAKDAYDLGWWQQFGDRLPERHLTLAAHEDVSTAITEFQTDLVPGLVQTESYMRALMKVSPIIPDGEIDERVELRLMRQDIFDRKKPANFHFFLDEHVLTRTGFGRQIMSDQVHHLLRMAVRPRVAIRVIPDAVGIHGGWYPFKLMDFIEINPVVFIENMTSTLFLERKDTIESYRQIAADLDRVALDEGQSRAWLATVATALGEPREEHDENAPSGDPDVEEKFFH
jgi:transcriptional regulator with XRE-family HTH domain